MKKRILSVMLAVFTVTALTACGSENKNETTTTTAATTTAAVTTTTAAVTTEPVMTDGEYPYPLNNGMQFVQNLKMGWNLGNTFDASSGGYDDLSYEKAWCGVLTTEQMIKDVHAAGFETIRIPVTWHKHVDENFNINEEWLNRVHEVVDYAINDGMYVILDIHHDNEKGYLYPDEENEETSFNYVTKIWEQLAAEFISYDEHLIFEAMNEPRLKDTPNEWSDDMNNEDIKKAIKIIDRINQGFVDTVRATGGNNATRYLMVPGYCAKISAAKVMTIPKDIDGNENRIIVSVHAYEPYNFALNTGGTDRWREDKASSTSSIDNVMNAVYENFTSKGIPVIIGESGAMAKDNDEARIAWAKYYYSNARARGITCFWWDNHSFTSGETFGLYNRITGEFTPKELLDAIMSSVE